MSEDRSLVRQLNAGGKQALRSGAPAMNLRPRLHRSGKSIVRSYAESVGINFGLNSMAVLKSEKSQKG